jgi:Zn finger protein HypA/HybF involved in hydrogenase expression
MREQRSTKAVFDKVIKQAGAARVKLIRIAFGEICELDQDKVRNHWIELSKGTPLEHVKLHFRPITAEAQCMACFKKYHPMNGTIHCPHCGSFGAKILSGEEFHVDSIETDNE